MGHPDSSEPEKAGIVERDMEEEKDCADNSSRPPLNHIRQGQLVYGTIVVLGYNGCLPQGEKGRRRSKYQLCRRNMANGVRRHKLYEVVTPQNSQAVLDAKQHSISYTMNRQQAIIVEYTSDPNTDMFQIGRSSEPAIDLVVMDTVAGDKRPPRLTQSTISRFACRLICDRDPMMPCVSVYAAGFNASRNIFLGEKATKWYTSGSVDGLTTNGVLLMHLDGPFVGGESTPNVWREASVGGQLYGLRESRSASSKGVKVENDNNILKDGSLIDLCGATLLWRTAEGLNSSPTSKDLEQMLEKLNAGRPLCPVGLNTLVIPRKSSGQSCSSETQPYAYLNCGHVQGGHEWGHDKDTEYRTCPICLKVGPVANVCLGAEAAFYVDRGPPTHVFNPCGHLASEKTVKFWTSIPIPHGTNGFHAACPFCATPVEGALGYIRLIFQDNVD